jgi:hypothetical protein
MPFPYKKLGESKQNYYIYSMRVNNPTITKDQVQEYIDTHNIMDDDGVGVNKYLKILNSVGYNNYPLNVPEFIEILDQGRLNILYYRLKDTFKLTKRYLHD